MKRFRSAATPATVLAAVLLAACDGSSAPTTPGGEPDRWVFGEAVHRTTNGMYVDKIALGDLNGDARTDVAALAREGGFSRLLVYLQSPAGTLALPVVVPIDSFDARSFAIGDLDGDGFDDVAVLGKPWMTLIGFLGALRVFHQDPATRTLGPAQRVTLSTHDPIDVTIGDLNSDGRKDLIVSGLWVREPGEGRVSVRYQQPGGTLGPEVINDNVGVIPGWITTAEMTGDGRNDIVLQSDMFELAVIPQAPTGGMSPQPHLYEVLTSYWPRFNVLAVGDLNGDGRNDVVAWGNGNATQVNVFLQQGDGRLARTVPFFLDVPPYGLDVADVDGDGLDDIVGYDVGIGSPPQGRVQVYRQTPQHGFEAAVVYYFTTGSGGGGAMHPLMAIGDVTGDGRPDAVAAWSDDGVWVLPAVRR